MTAQLLAMIAIALFVVAYLEWRHERAMAQFVARFSLPAPLPRPLLPPPPQPRTLTREELLGAVAARQRHMPFLLERQSSTRRMAHPIHPRFEAYGVDVSVSPTIGIV